MLVPLDLKKNIDSKFMNFMKTLPIHILAKKIKFWERLESKCNLSNTYDGSANFSDSPKVWQMKLRLWHGILPKNGQCLLGTKKSKIMPNVGFELFLSLPFTFPVLVNENPCQIYTENNQISIFNFFHLNLVHYQYYKNVPGSGSNARIRFADLFLTFLWKFLSS